MKKTGWILWTKTQTRLYKSNFLFSTCYIAYQNVVCSHLSLLASRSRKKWMSLLKNPRNGNYCRNVKPYLSLEKCEIKWICKTFVYTWYFMLKGNLKPGSVIQTSEFVRIRDRANTWKFGEFFPLYLKSNRHGSFRENFIVIVYKQTTIKSLEFPLTRKYLLYINQHLCNRNVTIKDSFSLKLIRRGHSKLI